MIWKAKTETIDNVVTTRTPKEYTIPKRLHRDYDLKLKYYASAEELRQIGVDANLLLTHTIPGIRYDPESKDATRKYKVSFRVMAHIDRFSTEMTNDYNF